MNNMDVRLARRSLEALDLYGADSDRRFLKIEHDRHGNPYVKCVEGLSFFEKITWYIFPDSWNQFSLNKISRVYGQVQALIQQNRDLQRQLLPLSDNIQRGVETINRKLSSYNYNRHFEVRPIFIPFAADTIRRGNDQHDLVRAPRRNTPVHRGVYNSGNMCYFNSIIQSLYSVPSFRFDAENSTRAQQIVENVFRGLDQVPGDGPISCAIYDKLRVLLANNGARTVYSGRQEDAVELLESIFDLCEMQIPHFSAQGHNIFKFPQFQVDETTARTSIQDIIRNNQLMLNTRPEEAPAILPIAVSRFNEEYEKIRTNVDPNQEVQVGAGHYNLFGNVRYKLRAVVHHVGKDASSGHYKISRPNNDGTWTVVDDQDVYTVAEQRGLPAEGYIYIYEKI